MFHLSSVIRLDFLSGPAPTDFTDRIYKFSQDLDKYLICSDLSCDVSKVGVHTFAIGDEGREFVVEIIDPVDDYVEMMKNIFDFPMIKDYLKSLKILLNSLHGGEIYNLSSTTR